MVRSVHSAVQSVEHVIREQVGGLGVLLSRRMPTGGLRALGFEPAYQTSLQLHFLAVAHLI